MTKSDTPGILCSGSIVYDTLVRPVDAPEWGTTTFVESIEYHVGGNGANTSMALATIGVPVRLVGAVGSDDQAMFVCEHLRRVGVDTSSVTRLDALTAATVVVINSAGERKFLHRPGASAAAFAEPLVFTPELTGGMAHYHLASLFVLPRMRAHAAECLVRARTAGLTTSLDTNWDPAGKWMADLAPCLPHLDVMFINEDEARMVTGSTDPESAAQVLLSGGVRIAVMKLGARGCTIFTQERKIVCPAFEVEARDTTGAGDCFVGGFLAARMRGACLEEAGVLANAVAALSVQRIGALAGVPPYDEVRAWMRTASLRPLEP